MKKSIVLPFITLYFLISSTSYVVAQKKITQGKAIFDITYPGADLDAQSLSMMPSESTIYFKGEWSRSESKTPLGTTVAITNSKLGETTTLLDIMGNKFAIKVSKADMDSEKKKNGIEKTETNITSETKIIAGYTCKKADVHYKMKDQTENTMVVWYTREIAAPNSMRSGGADFGDIDGFMMEFFSKQHDLNTKMTCRLVTESTVEDDKFTIPPEYKMTTMEDLKNYFGNGH
jgi:GLPGLI family protein